jgi:O-antigen ligase
METDTSMKPEKIISGSDSVILAGFCVLIFILPIAHTESIRAFSIGIPMAFWLLKMALQRRWLFVRTPLDVPILLFTAVAALSLLTAVDFRYSFEEFTGEWLFGVALFYLLANNFRREWLPYLLGALLIGNLVMVLYGSYEFFRQGGVLSDYQVRARSLHNIAGALATYLITVLPYFFVALFFYSGARRRTLLFFVVLLNLFTLYLTHVRGGWIVALLTAAAVCAKFFSRRGALALIAGGALFALWVLPSGVLVHHATLGKPGYPEGRIATEQARWEVMSFSWERIRENPFRMLGFGRGSFARQYPEFKEKYKGALLWHAHNTFLNLNLQTGLQGLVIFLFLVYKLLKFTYRSAESEREPLGRAFLFATFFMIGAFFVRNLMDDFFVDDAALLFWTLSGAAVAVKKG